MTRTVHWRTPSLAVNDSRGLPVRQVAYLRKVAGATAQTLITRQLYDTAGRLVEQWDPRLFDRAPKPNLATIYRLSGEPVNVDSVDAGWRLSLAGMAGEGLQRWDPMGGHWRITYDEQLRVIAVEENTQPNIERFTYADASADAGYNLRGQMIEQVDPSGSLTVDSYNLDGQALSETRTFADNTSYQSRRGFSALGAVLTQTDARDHEQLFGYDIAGQLKQVLLRLVPASAAQDIQIDAQYNAAGQLIEQHAGNGVVSLREYDPANGWLTGLQANPPNGSSLQKLTYEYDRVGNVLSINDPTFTPVYFANQRVDGQREFTYDSLYQLSSATGFEADIPNLRPGLPTPIVPIDSGRLFNYVQRYEYDEGGNLETLRHVREGNHHTQTMHLDPHNNRGVRWTEGEPVPVFDEHFDAHGNLLLLQKGQPLTWNRRDQLTVTRLVERSGGPDDEETYVYSQGQRVSKRLVTQAQSVSHVRQVRYLPGLEIRTLDDTEELHVITLGNVRCLHWVKGRPGAIDQDQLRYSLDDHLGSSALELDKDGALISQEIYYPFGGTAWWAADSQVQADYKTIRYSGKEMDVSGLYYYGARYYAPWLQRWVSADPGGDVDGLNLFAFVGNNPLLYVDRNGENREQYSVFNYSKFISVLADHAATTLAQVDDVIHGVNRKNGAIEEALLLNVIGESILGLVGYEGGALGAGYVGNLLPEDIHYASISQQTTAPFVAGLIGGNAGGDTAGMLFEPTARLIRPLIPQTSSMTISEIDRQAGITDGSFSWSVTDTMSFALNRVVGSVVPGVSAILNMGSRVQEAEDIQNRLDPVKIDKIETMLSNWSTALDERYAAAEAAFETLGRDVVSPSEIFPNINANSEDVLKQPIHRAYLGIQTAVTRDLIGRAQRGMAFYKEMGTTDNQWILKNPVKAKRQGLKLPSLR